MSRFQPKNFMLLPYMGCNAHCRYCFAPNTDEKMDLSMAYEAVRCIGRLAPRGKRITVTFHGGEPLLAGLGYYQTVIPMLYRELGRQRVRVSVQSNLHALTTEMAAFFKSNDVSVGTSLDGFPEMCGAQRGKDYPEKTMRGFELLWKAGMPSNAICTFTPAFADRAAEVFDYFASRGLPYSIHGAVRALGCEKSPDCVSVDEMARILLDSLAAYKTRMDATRIGTLDSMAAGCFSESGCVCTFFECLGAFAVFGPDGNIYSCQRFYGHPEYAVGELHADTAEADIVNSPGYARLLAMQRSAEESCGDCSHTKYCKGGCLYNIAAEGSVRDPYCEAYKTVFDKIAFDLALEMGGIMTGRLNETQTPLLSMAGDTPHPFAARQFRCRRKQALKWGAGKAPGYIRTDRLNKCYLHVTFRCPLGCDHCYASAGEGPEMDAAAVADAVLSACEAGFAATVLTGGEPLFHRQLDDMLERLGEIDRKGMKLILRTPFGFPVASEQLDKLLALFDEIVVSVDGDEASHDARRGKGVYRQVRANLDRVRALDGIDKLGVCATLALVDRRGAPGEAVETLCEAYGIKNVRYRPVLPLGRAKDTSCAEEYSCVDAASVTAPFSARWSCGLGNNLYVEPDGSVYPCYAWCAKSKLLGNLAETSIEAIVELPAFSGLRAHGVDTNEQCRDCGFRYLCGGMCKAFVGDKENIDSGGFSCKARKAMFAGLVRKMESRDIPGAADKTE